MVCIYYHKIVTSTIPEWMEIMNNIQNAAFTHGPSKIYMHELVDPCD